MGVSAEYLQAHKLTGRLSYRRVLPPELRLFLAPSAAGTLPPTEVKRSLGATSILATGALERFRAAEAEFAAMIAQALRVQARAEALARGAYDTLEPARIDYLGKVFEIELLKRDAAAIWTKGPDRTDRMRAGWSENLGDFRRWHGEGDMEAIEAEWQDAAHALLDDQGLTIDPASDGLRLLCRELNAATIRAAPVALAQLNGEMLRKKDDDRNLFHIGSAWKDSRAYDAQGDVE